MNAGGPSAGSPGSLEHVVGAPDVRREDVFEVGLVRVVEGHPLLEDHAREDLDHVGVADRGDLAPAQLGACDAHEHLFLVTPAQPGDELVGLCFADHPGVRFQADAHAVVTHQRVRVRVVGGDAGPGGGLLCSLDLDAGLGEPVQLAVDPVGQLASGLAGEGDAEHLVRGGEAIGDQPHHAVRHGGRLARTGAGHHEPRFER